MSDATLKHLHPAVRAGALLDDQTRIRALQCDRWIDYSHATQALQLLERLLAMPERQRMPCMLLHGDSNIGKTLVITKFLRDHPANFDTRRGVEQRQIVSMQMPATPDQHRFYSALLYELGAPHSASATLSVLERLARDLLQHIAPRMLIVDEVHHLLAGGYREQRAALNLLKYLANDLRLSVVIVGTADALLAMEHDAQMRSRFTPFEIPRWRENDEFRGLLAAFEKILPLRRPSELSQRAIVQFVLTASAGLTGEISRLITEAAELAILDRSEQIMVAHLERVARA